MAFPNSGNFDYWLGGRPLATLARDTGNFDYWLGGRPIRVGAGIVTQFGRPISDISAGTWTPSTGVDLYAVIDELNYDDADYDTVTDPSSAVFEVKLTSLSDPVSSVDHVVRYRLAGVDGACNFTVALRQGSSTEIASWTHNSVTTATTFTKTLTGGETDNITDYTDLRLRFTATKV